MNKQLSNAFAFSKKVHMMAFRCGSVKALPPTHQKETQSGGGGGKGNERINDSLKTCLG